jgi:hypothetical protein
MANQLNVVFHGTFVFINWGTSLEVLVPDVRHHVYKAGTFKKEVDVIPGTTFNLVGVTAEAAVPPLEDLGIGVISRKRIIRRDAALVKFSLILPPPFQFAAKRCYQRSDGKPVFVGDDGSAVTLARTNYATAHVASYHCPVPGAVELCGLDWVPEPDAAGIVNLHIFAEPGDPEMLDDAHIHDSFREAMFLFGSNLAIRRQRDATFDDAPVCPGSPVIDGLPAEQEMSLADRELPFGAGTDPANCASGGSDNRG